MPDPFIEITSVTPLDDGSTAGGGRSFGWRALVSAALWVSAAVLAVVASFARVYSITTPLPGVPIGAVRYSYDGWGRGSTSASSQLQFGSGELVGPRYGVLFCSAAALLLVAAWLGLAQPKARWLPSARFLGGVATPFLAGSGASQIIAVLPYRHGITHTDNVFSFGASPWCATAASALAAMGWSMYRQPKQSG